jgi:hypothetical protein
MRCGRYPEFKGGPRQLERSTILLMKKLLIVSPHFPPVNAPDMQRVRMALPFLKENGWEATVLCVNSAFIENPTLDEHLAATVPAQAEVVRTRAVPVRLVRPVGFGNLAFRALPFLWRAGSRLLSRGKFDLVFFSTTQFPVLILGPIWKRRFGVPYVVDFQDPWLTDYYKRAKIEPPGGQKKYAVSQFLGRLFEPRVMKNVSAAITVSPDYIEQLCARYSFLRAEQFATIPFGASERDFDLLGKLNVEPAVQRRPNSCNIVYAGAAGPYMIRSLRLLFKAIADARKRDPDFWRQVQFHFIGTSYAPNPRDDGVVSQIADEFGLTNCVSEQTQRISYFQTLATLRAADGLLILGSDSPDYNPSKIATYLMARRPILAVMHEKSPATDILSRAGPAALVTFSSTAEPPAEQMRQMLDDFIRRMQTKDPLPLDGNVLASISAREMTRQICDIFNRKVLS